MSQSRTTSGEPDVLVLADPDEVSAAAAERIADTLAGAVAARGRADWLTTGGSAAPAIYRRLSVPPLRERIPWRDVHLWWGDDRYVPRDHRLSNVMPVDQILLSGGARGGQSGTGEDAHDVFTGIDAGVGLRTANVHPFPIAAAIGEGQGAAWAARTYAEELGAGGLEIVDGWPAFDIALIGVGPDGHLLSVFPGSPAFDDGSAWALAIPAPTHVEPHVERVTLNPRVLDVARQVLVVVHGESKAQILGELFGPTRDPRRLPGQILRRPGATWLLDRAAAARLPSTAGSADGNR